MYYHFSEDPSITRFEPRKPKEFPDKPPLVWAIDDRHAPLYYFPRDCPRVAFWKSTHTTEEDISRFLSYSDAKMIIAVESSWLDLIKKTKLYRYHFSPETFTCFDENAGYYTSELAVEPARVDLIGDLLEAHTCAQIELRFTPNLFPLREAILSSTLNFSMIRMRNASRN